MEVLDSGSAVADTDFLECGAVVKSGVAKLETADIVELADSCSSSAAEAFLEISAASVSVATVDSGSPVELTATDAFVELSGTAVELFDRSKARGPEELLDTADALDMCTTVVPVDALLLLTRGAPDELLETRFKVAEALDTVVPVGVMLLLAREAPDELLETRFKVVEALDTVVPVGVMLLLAGGAPEELLDTRFKVAEALDTVVPVGVMLLLAEGAPEELLETRFKVTEALDTVE